MKRLFRHIYILMAVLLGTSLCACRSNDIPEMPESKGRVMLDLNVAVADVSSATRAFPGSEDGSFENPASAYEGVNTLRVVIVHKGGDLDGIIEHNRQVAVNYQTGTIINDNLRFSVTSNEDKRIYLFANEASVDYDFSKLEPGTLFPEDEVNAIELTRKPNAAYIDNSAASYNRGFVPMSEVFDVNVPEPENDQLTYQTEYLFLTRSLIKFSFCFLTKPGYEQSGVKIRGVKIEGLANSGYYMPKATVYDPAKYNVSAYPLKGRYITSFSTPADPGYSNYDFPFDIPAEEIKDGLDISYSPYVYFPESKTPQGGSYKLSLILDGPGAEFLTPEPLQITDIPRNTHVKVNITLTSTSIKPEVVLLPYTECILEPDFGL